MEILKNSILRIFFERGKSIPGFFPYAKRKYGFRFASLHPCTAGHLEKFRPWNSSGC